MNGRSSVGSSPALMCATLIFSIVHAGQTSEFSHANIHPSIIYIAHPFRVRGDLKIIPAGWDEPGYTPGRSPTYRRGTCQQCHIIEINMPHKERSTGHSNEVFTVRLEYTIRKSSYLTAVIKYHFSASEGRS